MNEQNKKSLSEFEAAAGMSDEEFRFTHTLMPSVVGYVEAMAGTTGVSEQVLCNSFMSGAATCLAVLEHSGVDIADASSAMAKVGGVLKPAE